MTMVIIMVMSVVVIVLGFENVSTLHHTVVHKSATFIF